MRDFVMWRSEGGLALKTQALLVERHIFLEATFGIRLSDWFHRRLTNVVPPQTRRNCSTPCSPNTASILTQSVPRECTWCRLRRKCRTLS